VVALGAESSQITLLGPLATGAGIGYGLGMIKRALLAASLLALLAPATSSAQTLGSVRHNWSVTGAKTRVVQLVVHKITPGNAVVEVTCDGKGCPFKDRVFKPRNGKVVLTRTFAFTTRRGKIPAVASACAIFGSTSPVGCPGTQGPQGPAGAQGPAGPAGARGANGTNGTNGANATTLWAVVNSNGTLNRGSRVTSVGRIGGGVYEVIFNRDVSGCAYIGAVSDPGFGAAFGFFSASKRGGQPNGIFIETTNSTGTVADQPFHVAVFC
jgi:hypothetical protein